MGTLDYTVILLYFLGLIAVSIVMSRKIKSSEDMFIAGRNSSWWLSGVSSYMTIFSASTFVVWGGVAYKSGLVAVVVAICLGIASLIVGKWISSRWRRLKIKSPGEFLTVRFGHGTVSFYTIAGIIARAVHTAVALYAVAVVMCALVKVPDGSIFASTGLPGDTAAGYLSIWWALLILGAIALAYTIAGGFLAVLMTDVIQFGVLISVVIFMIPLSFHAVGGGAEFISRASEIPGFFSGTSGTYTWTWLALWIFLNVAMIGGDWPFVQRYISVPTSRDAKWSTYLIGILYFVTPLIWYLPTMIYRVMEPGLALGADASAMTWNGEHAYVNMSKLVLMSGMLGMMLAAMLSATLSNVSGILNVYANVYTYEIWGHHEKNRNADEKKRIKVGRLFTLAFGLAIIGISMLVPFAGGAEKVVVTLLTMIMCPLYIPSIWGLFSRRLTGRQLMIAMLLTWAAGITAKLAVPASIMSQSMIESISGCILPVLILAIMEICSKYRKEEAAGYAEMLGYNDPEADTEPDAKMKAATKSYSLMAVSCFCITIGVIALMLLALIIFGDPKTLAVKNIVWGFIISIFVIIAAYIIYRCRDRKKAGGTAAAAAMLLIPSVADAQIYVEPEQDVECSVFIPKERKTGAQQGIEIYGGYVFCLEDGGHVNVYDYKTASPVPVAEFWLASSRPDNHANNASFGTEIQKGADFPLLYITNGKVGSEIEWTCFVESIRKRGRKFTSEIAQTITLDASGWEERGYVPVFGAPSWMVDRERNFLWVFSARKRTVHKVTKHTWENQYVATKFRVPALAEGKEIRLDANDILDQAVFPFETWFTQAGCVHDGKIHYSFGAGNTDPEHRPSRIRVYDTDTRTISARYELQEQLPYELEDIAIADGWMYVNTNMRPGTALPAVFKVSLPKPKESPASPEEEIRQCPEKAGGIYYVRDLAPESVSAAPEGYKPFYINGFFRHGARQMDDAVTYVRIYESLETAQEEGNLTEFGEAILKRLAPFKRNVMYREGDLTQIGYRQARALGGRMADNYPEVFDGVPYLKAEATNVLRVSATMQSVIQGIVSRRPSLEWNSIDNSRSFLPELNPYGMVCPGKLAIDGAMHSSEGPWYRKYCDFRDSMIDADVFLSRLFRNTETVKEKYGDAYDLVRRYWLMASVMQCLDRQVPLWDLFTEDEILAWAKAENYRYYAQKGPEPVNCGRGWGLGSRTLRHILEESDADIRAGRHGVDLNFGHDGTLMAIMTNLAAGTWAEATDRPEEVLGLWQYWNIPMGANLQLVFYRKMENDDILVKFMLNEEDIELPLKAVANRFYRWKEVYSHYMKHCADTEEMLRETAELTL